MSSWRYLTCTHGNTHPSENKRQGPSFHVCLHMCRQRGARFWFLKNPQVERQPESQPGPGYVVYQEKQSFTNFFSV